MKLEMRQSQSLVMTPQLQQAIKLLQLSNIELNAFVEEELERNPILERRDDNDNANDLSSADADKSEKTEGETGETADTWLEGGQGAGDPAGDLDTDYTNVDPDATSADRVNEAADGPRDDWTSATTGAQGTGEGYNLEAFVTEEK
ncbi:MAG: RNA polymerase sigma-54 factor, partial [Pseudomonadota bacterium]